MPISQFDRASQPMTDARPRRAILVGMMGSGKTTIGTRLAEVTGWPYVDNDELVRRLTGMTSRGILASEGEDRLREVEAEALVLGTRLPPPLVLGVAAGTILDGTNRDRLREVDLVVWLRADPAVLEARASGGEHRPFVDEEGRSWMADATRDRAPLYAEVADLVVDTDAVSPDEAVAMIRERLAAR